MKKKVWIINHYATQMYRDKAGRHYWFARLLKEQGYETIVFCANTFHNKAEKIIINKGKFKIEDQNGIPYVFVKTVPACGNGLDRVKNMVYFFFNLFGASRSITKNFGIPDIILASSVHPLTMVAGILISKRLKVPCVCEIRDLWPEAIFEFGKANPKSLLGSLLIKGEHWIYRKADRLIFTKEGDTDYIKERKWNIEQGGDIDLKKCFYINNGINMESFDKMINEEIIDDIDLIDISKFNVVYTGMIRPVNNVGNLIDCAKLFEEEDKIQFLIYGDGNQLAELQSRVKNENIKNVHLKGFVDRNKIPYILSKSNVNILNYSQNQYNWSRGNSSNKLFEYLASGKPVISTVKMGYCIIEKYNCGLSLEKCTPHDLKNAILEIKNLDKNSYNMLGNNARKAAEDFDYNILTERLINVLETINFKK